MYRRLKTLDFHGLQPPFLALYDTERYHGSTQCDDVGFVYRERHGKSRNYTKFERQCWITAPFYVDYGNNIYFGNNCEVNMNCTFLDDNVIAVGNPCRIIKENK